MTSKPRLRKIIEEDPFSEEECDDLSFSSASSTCTDDDFDDKQWMQSYYTINDKPVGVPRRQKELNKLNMLLLLPVLLLSISFLAPDFINWSVNESMPLEHGIESMHMEPSKFESVHGGHGMAAPAVVADVVDAFVCDYRNTPVKLQSISHGKVARICIRPSESSVSLEGINYFSLYQAEADVDQVIVEDSDIVEAGVTQLDCTEDLCVLETYLSGDYFLSGGLTVMAMGLVKATNEVRLRGSEPVRDCSFSKIELSLKVKTKPMPARIEPLEKTVTKLRKAHLDNTKVNAFLRETNTKRIRDLQNKRGSNMHKYAVEEHMPDSRSRPQRRRPSSDRLLGNDTRTYAERRRIRASSNERLVDSSSQK